MTQAKIRERMRRMRRMLPEEKQLAASRDCCLRIMETQAYRGASVLMAYIAARGELSLAPLIADALASGKTLALPRCEGAGSMSARQIASLTELAPGTFGLLEPDARCPELAPEAIELILVPGTAFDWRGGRVGQGGGYYDRFLPRTRALRVGVCHDFALLDSVETATHDQRMDWIATPQTIVRIR